jgi:hypothetical protein
MPRQRDITNKHVAFRTKQNRISWNHHINSTHLPVICSNRLLVRVFVDSNILNGIGVIMVLKRRYRGQMSMSYDGYSVYHGTALLTLLSRP